LSTAAHRLQQLHLDDVDQVQCHGPLSSMSTSEARQQLGMVRLFAQLARHVSAAASQAAACRRPPKADRSGFRRPNSDRRNGGRPSIHPIVAPQDDGLQAQVRTPVAVS
jgi:hypothetical protein